MKWWRRVKRKIEALDRLDRMRMARLTPDERAWIAYWRWRAMIDLGW